MNWARGVSMTTVRRVLVFSFVLVIFLCLSACGQETRDADGLPAVESTNPPMSDSLSPPVSIPPQPSATGPETQSQEPVDTAIPEQGGNDTAEQNTPPQTTKDDPVNSGVSSPPPSETTTPPKETTAPPNEPAPSPGGPVILTISGDGVSGETTWTLSQLQAMQEGYREYIYSTTNNWPSFSHTTAHGVSLPYLLSRAEILDSAVGFRLISTDGYHVTVTRNQIYGRSYSYASHSAAGSGGASAVEPIISWEWGDGGRVRPENIRSFFGQIGPMEVNTFAFVRNLTRIEVSTSSAGAWAPPGASITDGETVPYGTELSLLHDNMDGIRIYYTLDGSEPDYTSTVYNMSTSYYQPQLIVPIELKESVTVKTFAAGIGRDASPVVTFNITVSE